MHALVRLCAAHTCWLLIPTQPNGVGIAVQETLETKHGANRNQTGNFEALVSSQSESFAVRKAKFLEIRANVDQAINKKFKDMLRTGRNWRGKIQVDHDSHEVFLSVTPHKGVFSQVSDRQEQMGTCLPLAFV